MFDGHLRKSVDKRTGPIGEAVRRTGVTADHLTVAGLLIALGATIAIATGRPILAAVLLVLAAIPDLLDGAVAKASGTASVRGAFFDSTADRVTDSLVLGGIGWYLATERGAHWALLAFAVLAVSNLVSYERAKGEALGFSAKGGLMERAERIIALTAGLVFTVVLVPILVVLLVLTTITAIQRFWKVWQQASEARAAEFRERGLPVRPTRVRHRQTGDRVSLEQRWQAWRSSSPRSRSRVSAGSGSRWRSRPRRSRP